MFQKLTTATRAFATASTVLVLCAVIEIVWIRHGGTPELVVWLSVVVCGACTWLYAHYFVQLRFGVLFQAFERMAHGELDLELPPPPDADVASIRSAMLSAAGALRDLTQRLRDADAARRRLFSDLSHELATPSSTIIALVDALASPDLAKSAAEQQEIVAALSAETARLARLVADMRDLGQLDDPDFALELEKVDLAEIAANVVSRLKLTKLEGFDVEVEVEPVTAVIDRERIEQVMVNLLTNAARYAPEAKRLRVALSRLDGHARIVVDDAGEGVPSDVLPRLGERLLRVDPSRSRKTGGSGLGLSIVRAIVERHGGNVHFGKSSLGGLEVKIDLPIEARNDSR